MAKGTCTIEGCGRPRSGRGWCGMHYQRWQKHGDPLHLRLNNGDPLAFWHLVDKNGPVPEGRPDLGPCWLWTGHLNAKGYGRLTMDRREVRAHRRAYELLVGDLPERPLCMDHLCRVRRCVNPAHLEVVTLGENVLRGDTIVARNAAKTHCDHGHPFDEANTGWTKDGERICRACGRARYHRKKHMWRAESSTPSS